MANAMEEEYHDPYAFIGSSCKITPSQVAILRKCPMDRQYEVFPSPMEPDFLSSQPSGILMDSVPESQGTAEPEADDLSVFHTPPEHHINSNYSSSSDRNPDELCAQGARAAEFGNGKDGSEQDSRFQGGLGDEPRAKKIRVRQNELPGVTVSLGRTEVLVVNTAGADAVEVINLDSGDDNEETMVADVTEDSHDILNGAGAKVLSANSLQESTSLKKQCAPVVDENHESRRKCDEPTCDVKADGTKRPHGSCKSGDIIGKLDIRETEDEIVRLKSIVGNRSGKFAEISENEKGGKDGNPRGGMRNGGKRIDDIDEFMFTGRDDVSRGWRDRKTSASGPSGKTRELPVSVKGTADWGGSMEEKENNEERLMMGEEKNQGGSNVARKVVTGSGGVRKAKEKSDSRCGVAGKAETETIGVIKGKEKAAGGRSVAGKMETKNGGLNKEERSDMGSDLAGTVERRLIEGKDKNEGREEARNVGAISGGLSQGNVKNNGGRNVLVKLDLGNGLMGMLEGLKRIIGNMDNDDEDSLEIAKKKGITLPRPRWWDPEWSD